MRGVGQQAVIHKMHVIDKFVFSDQLSILIQ